MAESTAGGIDPRIDHLISRLVDDATARDELVRLGRPALERLLAVEEGTGSTNFGASHPTDVADGLTAAVSAFLRADTDLFFSVLDEHPGNASVACVLYGWTDHRAVAYLVDCLDAGAWPVRWAAAGALGSQGDRSVVGRLSKLLNDSQPLVRGAVLEALGSLGGPEATLAVVAFVEAPPSGSAIPEVEKAATILERLRHTGFLDPSAPAAAIANRLIKDFAEWAERDTRLHSVRGHLSTEAEYVLDQDLLWRASGNPSVSADLLFHPSHANWNAVFDGRSPWVSATLMLTPERHPVIALAVQSPPNRRPTDATFDRVALALSYEPRTLELG